MVVAGKVKEVLTVLSDSKYLSPKLLGLIRHIITIIGTILVLRGYSSTESIELVGDQIINLLTNLDVIIGEFLLVISQVGSWFAKEKQPKNGV